MDGRTVDLSSLAMDTGMTDETTDGVIVNGAGNALGLTLTGSSAADVITGGSGADAITGGNGIDVITGGDGVDTITLTEGTAAADDVVLDDDDSVDNIIGFDVDGLDEIMIDISAYATELGAGTIASEAGSAAIGTGQAAILSAAAGASTAATGSTEGCSKSPTQLV